MKRLSRASAALGLLLAVLMPLEQGRCALRSLWPSTVTSPATHSKADDDCCDDSSSPAKPAAPTDPCCFDSPPLPEATAPVSVSLPRPPVGSAPLAALVANAPACEASDPFVARVLPTGSPPDPASSPKSPRSPPHAA